MAALFFPNLDVLRIALASGLIPRTITSAGALAGVDDHGHLWLEPDVFPARDTIGALSRLGVLVLGSPSVPTHYTRCWAELLTLRRVIATTGGTVLFDVPDKYVTAFVARFHAAPVGIRLLPEPYEGRAWVTSTAPPLPVLLWVDEADCPIRSYYQQTANVWTRRGWEHPLASHLAPPSDCILLNCPEFGIRYFPAPIPKPYEHELPLRHRNIPLKPTEATSQIDVRFRLVRSRSVRDETLWILTVPEEERFRTFCRNADERMLRRFQAATVTLGEETRLLLRRNPNDTGAILIGIAEGFQSDSTLPMLFIPSGFSLRPRIRAAELAREFHLSDERLIWLEATSDSEIAIHSVTLTAFSPLSERLDYVAPRAVRLNADRPGEKQFPLARIALQYDAIPEPEPVTDEQLEEAELQQDESVEEPSWVIKSVERMMNWVRAQGEWLSNRSLALPSADELKTALPGKPQPSQSASTHAGHFERKLTSADALLHGHDRAARRHDMESQLLKDFPALGPEQRAARWAELASVYGATGMSLDSAVCWATAIWECPTPPTEWLDRWAEMECHAAKPGDRAASLDRWLGEPGRAGTGRVVASLSALFGFQPTVSPEFIAALPQVLAILDHHFDDIPVRAAWLARVAVARSCDGDTLGLARWRDRLIHRLHERGPGLDLDEPSFLRFRGTASADRFQTAREWLTRVRQPILEWVQRQAGNDQLQWTGLEGEGEATAIYTQFLLAWGLGVLGERTRSRDWAARARKSLARATGPRVDPAGHAFLGDLFLHRIKDAHEGRLPKPGVPNELQERLEKLPYFARYSVDRLREHCHVLQPTGPVRAFQGLDLKEFWGTDRLGERLSILSSTSNLAHLNDEAKALLELAATEPTTATLPRIVMSLLEMAAGLEASTIAALLDLLPTALDWTEAWLQTGRWSEAERSERVRRFQSRMIASAFAVASTGAAEHLMQHLSRSGTSGRLIGAVGNAAPQIFRTARKFGLTAESDALMSILDPTRGEWGKAPLSAERVGLAVGWFAAGDQDAGNRILNLTREWLFLTAPTDLQQRTAIAIAYAESLGFAPAGIALGRLEELFQRLDRVAVNGSTNCYFTLQPLRLIDTVVRSVVTDEFTLGTAVRAWLDEDEFLIRRRIHRDMAMLLRESELE